MEPEARLGETGRERRPRLLPTPPTGCATTVVTQPRAVPAQRHGPVGKATVLQHPVAPAMRAAPQRHVEPSCTERSRPGQSSPGPVLVTLNQGRRWISPSEGLQKLPKLLQQPGLAASCPWKHLQHQQQPRTCTSRGRSQLSSCPPTRPGPAPALPPLRAKPRGKNKPRAPGLAQRPYLLENSMDSLTVSFPPAACICCLLFFSPWWGDQGSILAAPGLQRALPSTSAWPELPFLITLEIM